MDNIDPVLLFFFTIALMVNIWCFGEWRKIKQRRKDEHIPEPELVGDFSSFDLGCPVKDCGWYFQSNEMLAEHTKQGKHGV